MLCECTLFPVRPSDGIAANLPGRKCERKRSLRTREGSAPFADGSCRRPDWSLRGSAASRRPCLQRCRSVARAQRIPTEPPSGECPRPPPAVRSRRTARCPCFWCCYATRRVLGWRGPRLRADKMQRGRKSAASASARSGRRSPVSAKEVIEINSTGGSSRQAALVPCQMAIPPRRSVDFGDNLVHRAQQVPNSDTRKRTPSRLYSPTPRSTSSIRCDAVGTSWLSKWSLQTLRNWPGLLVRRRPQLRLDRRGGPLANTSGPPPG